MQSNSVALQGFESRNAALSSVRRGRDLFAAAKRVVTKSYTAHQKIIKPNTNLKIQESCNF
jgi:hypothetical protein